MFPLAILLIFFASLIGLILFIARRQEKKIQPRLDQIALQLNASKSGQGLGAVYKTIECRYGYVPGSRYRPTHLFVAISAASGASFQIIKAGSLDQLARGLGIAAGIQTGDSLFDEAFCLMSDQASFASALFASPEKREAVRELFRLGFTDIGHDGASIKATWSPFKLDESFSPLAISSAVSQMKILAKNMPSPTLAAEEAPPPRWKLAETLTLLPIVLLLGGFFLWIYSELHFQPLDKTRLILESLKYSPLLFLAYLGLLALLLRGRSSASQLVKGTFLLSCFAFPVSSIALGIALNGRLDASAATPHAAMVAGRSKRSGGRGGSDFYIWVSSWRKSGDFEKIKVFRAFYDQVVPHKTSVTAFTKPGRFGFEWVQSIAISPQPFVPELERELQAARALMRSGDKDKSIEKARRVFQDAEDEKLIREAASLLSELGVPAPSPEASLAASAGAASAIKIGLVPIGSVNKWLLAELVPELQSKSGLGFFIAQESLPSAGRDRLAPGGQDGQADVARLMDEVEARYPPGARPEVQGYLGVTEADLFAQDMNFVFANAKRGYAVMSYRRFLAATNDETPRRPRLRERFLKQAITSGFFILGIPRCASPLCVRAYPNSLAELDHKGAELCSWCREQLALRFPQTPR